MGNMFTKHSEESKELEDQVTKPDIGEEQRRWLIVGLCLHDLVSPALRTYVRQLVEIEYQHFKTSHKIEAQDDSNYLKQYFPTNQDLQYININNNAQLKGDNGKPDWKKFDFQVKGPVDFSKLFVQSKMLHYTGLDNTCDESALLKIIEKVDVFSQPIKTVTEELRKDVRNPWAHVDFKEWDIEKYEKSFELMTQVIKEIKPSEEKEIIDQLTYWKSNGMQVLGGSKVELELLENLTEKTKALTLYIKEREKTSNDKFETCINALTEISLSLDICLQKLNEKLGELESRVDTHDAKLEQVSKDIKDVKSAVDVNNVNQRQHQGDVASKETEDTRELAKDTQYEKLQLQLEAEIETDSSETNANPSDIPATSTSISEKTVYDAVLLYAECDLDIAKDVLSNLKTVSDEYKIVLVDELQIANITLFDAMEYVKDSCRLIFIVATENFTMDALTKYQVQMLLRDFINCEQPRVVPIRLKKNTANIPKEIDALVGLKYYHFDSSENSNNTEIFIKAFKGVIENGKQNFLKHR